jgi:hypothetical protein
MRRPSGRLVLLALACALPVALAVFVLCSASNVPIYDEWLWSPLVIAAHDGTLAPAQLWAQQNSHRSVLPTLIGLALAALTGWDTRAEALLSVALAIVCQGCLYALIARRYGRERALGPFVLASVLLYSLAQSENFLWGFQFSWWLVDALVLGLVLALAGLPEGARGAARFAAALLCAIAASFSMIFGFAAWVAGAAMLFAVPGRRSVVLRAVWLLAALACMAAFFHGYQRPVDEHGWFLEDAAPWLDVPQFTLAVLGSPFGLYGGHIVAELLGAVLCIAFVAAMLRSRRTGEETAPWLALFAYAVAVAALTALGRTAYGLEGAVLSRYTTPATLAWIALGVLAFPVLRERRALTAFLAASFVAANVAGIVISWQFDGEERELAAHIRHVDTASDAELWRGFTNDYGVDQPAFVRAQTRELALRHLGPFNAFAGADVVPPVAAAPAGLPEPFAVPEVQPRILAVAFDKTAYRWGDLMHVSVVTTANVGAVEATLTAGVPLSPPLRLQESTYGKFAGLVRIPFPPPLIAMPPLTLAVDVRAIGGEGTFATRRVAFDLH